MTGTFTEALTTDLDPGEVFQLRTGLSIPRGAVLAILAFLDMHGITSVDPGPAAPDTVEWAAGVLAALEPAAVEAAVLDAVLPGSGRYATTAATIGYCITALRNAGAST